jgi:hypothetical protein
MSLSSANWSLEMAIDDVLTEICQFLLGFDIYHLHMVSKSMKMRLLTKNLVRYLTWGDDMPVEAFPAFSYQFCHLEIFCLMMIGVDMPLWYTTGEDILKLPKTLKTLRLGFRGAHSLWFANYRPKTVKLQYITNITGSEEDFEHLYDLKAAFPQLQTLELSGENSQIGARLLTFFSSTLTSATISCLRWDPQVFSCQFPANLRYLSLEKASTVEWDRLASLTQLERLELINLRQEPPERFWPTLQSLRLGWGTVWSEKSLFALSQLNSLTSIRCPSQSIIPWLPHSLTVARVEGGPAVPVESLKKLPPNLKTLACSKIVGDFSQFNFWPVHLTDLSFVLESSDVFPAKDERWLCLPKGLTYLSARNNAYHPIDIHPSMLPPLLNHSDTRKYGLENEIFDYSHLQALSSLYVTICHPSLPPISIKQILASAITLHHVDDSLMKTQIQPPSSSSPSQSDTAFQFILSRNLNSFGWGHESEEDIPMPDTLCFRDSFASWLPNSLRWFACDDARLLTDQFLAQIPRGLLTLELKIMDNSCPALFSSEGLKVLPPGLTTLIIAVDANVDDSFIPFLPSSLIKLDISRMTTLNDTSVELLPRGLKYFHMRHLTSGITDACISSLPRWLEHIELEHDRSLSPEAFFACSFPKLAYLDIRRNPNFTKSRVLPRAPRTLHIKGRKFLRN